MRCPMATGGQCLLVVGHDGDHAFAGLPPSATGRMTPGIKAILLRAKEEHDRADAAKGSDDALDAIVRAEFLLKLADRLEAVAVELGARGVL